MAVRVGQKDHKSVRHNSGRIRSMEQKSVEGKLMQSFLPEPLHFISREVILLFSVSSPLTFIFVILVSCKQYKALQGPFTLMTVRYVRATLYFYLSVFSVKTSNFFFRKKKLFESSKSVVVKMI